MSSSTRPRSPTGAGVAGRSDARHEAQCRRCGVSCHLAIPVNNTPVMIPGLRCRHLQRDGAQWGCGVYARRFEVAPWCHHADVAGPQGFLARDCPYVIEGGYRRGKVKLGEAAYRRYWPALLAEIGRHGVPEWVNREALLAEITAREGGAWRLRAEGDLLFPERAAPASSPQEVERGRQIGATREGTGDE